MSASFGSYKLSFGLYCFMAALVLSRACRIQDPDMQRMLTRSSVPSVPF